MNILSQEQKVGERIALARKNAGLSQGELGKRIGVTKATVCDYEKGRTLPEAKRLPKLAKALSVSLDRLMAESDCPMSSAASTGFTVEATTDTSGLTLLGHYAVAPTSPKAAVLERVPNPHPGVQYLVRFAAPEFTSLCPLTGQPDFAHLVIDYIPDDWLVESKSLKLYLSAFRNHGAFHEACTVAIARRLVAEIAPAWLRIGGYWYPRGGIPIDVFYQTGPAPAGVWVPDQGVQPYRGRG